MNKCNACMNADTTTTSEMPNAIKSAWEEVKQLTESWEERNRECTRQLDHATDRYRKAKQRQDVIHRELTTKSADRDRLQNRLEQVLLQIDKLSRSTVENVAEGNRRQVDGEYMYDKYKDRKKDIKQGKLKLSRVRAELNERYNYLEEVERKYRQKCDQIKTLRQRKTKLEASICTARQKCVSLRSRVKANDNTKHDGEKILSDMDSKIVELETKAMFDEQSVMTMEIYKERLQDDILRQQLQRREMIDKTERNKEMLKRMKSGRIRVYQPQSYH